METRVVWVEKGEDYAFHYLNHGHRFFEYQGKFWFQVQTSRGYEALEGMEDTGFDTIIEGIETLFFR